MRKRLLLSAVIILLCVALAALILTACSEEKDVAITFYDASDSSSWITLNGNKWTDSKGGFGRYSVSDDRITFTEDGETTMTGILTDGMLTLEKRGVVVGVYYADILSGLFDPDEDYDPYQPADPGYYEPTPIQYSIYFYVDGALFTTRKANMYEYVDLPTPTKFGYSFVCWETAAGRRISGDRYWVTSSVSFYAVWSKSIGVYSDSYLKVAPAREGVKRDEYYELGELYGVDTYVYFHLSRENLPSSFDTTHNLFLRDLRGVSFEMKGDYYITWYNSNFSPNATQHFHLETGSNVYFVTISDRYGIVQKTYLVDLYLLSEYTVSLYESRYSSEPYRQIVVQEGDNLPSSFAPTSVGGFTFDHWEYYDAVYERYYTFYTTSDITSDMRLNQTYQSYNPSFSLNGGSLSGSISITPYNPNRYLPVPTREGYDFCGWKGESSGYYVTDRYGYSGNWYYSQYTGTLSAVWQKKVVYYSYSGDHLTTRKMDLEIEYSSDGSWANIDHSVTINGEKIWTSSCLYAEVGTSLKPSSSSRYGYTWLGWYEYGSRIDSGFRYVLTWEDRDLYSEWMTCPVTLEVNDSSAGYVSGVSGVTALGEDTTIYANTMQSGYTWLGWYLGDEKVSQGTSMEYTFVMSETPVTYTAKWMVCPVTVERNNYYAGSVNAYGLYYGAVGDEITLSASTNGGYTWLGWYQGGVKISSGKSTDYIFTMGTDQRTYTAKWSKATVAMNDQSAGRVTALNDVYFLGDRVTVTATTYDGYTWLGWYRDQTLISTDAELSIEMLSEDVTYTATWGAYSVTTTGYSAGEQFCDTPVLSFDLNGGDGNCPAAQSITDTQGMVYPTLIPEKEGYVFIGWYDYYQMSVFDFAYPISENTTVKASWRSHSGSGVLPLNGRLSSVTVSPKSDRESFRYYAFVPLVSGLITLYSEGEGDSYGYLYDGDFVLLAQDDDDGSGRNFSISYSVTAGNLYYLLPCGYSKTLTLDVCMSGAQYPEAGGKAPYTPRGSYTVMDHQLVRAGESVTLEAGIPSTDYVWSGWYEGETLVTTDMTYTFTMPDRSLSLNAKWVTSPVIISKNVEGAGTVAWASDPFVGEYATLQATVEPGYTWVGWYDGDDLISEDLTYTFSLGYQAPATLTATWTYYTISTEMFVNNVSAAPAATLSFDLNGGSGVTPSDQMITDSVGMTYPTAIPTRSGYVFAGWSTDPEGRDRFDFSATIYGNVTLYAIWYQHSGIGVLPLNGTLESITVPGQGQPRQYYAFVPLVSGNVTLSSSGNNNDSFGFLYDAGKNLLASNDDGAGNQFLIEYYVTAGELYYLAPAAYHQSNPITINVYMTGALYPSAGGTYSAGVPGGTYTEYSEEKVTVGEQVTLVASTTAGYTWLGWYVGDQKVSSGSDMTYTFVMTAENKVYTAKWWAD